MLMLALPWGKVLGSHGKPQAGLWLWILAHWG